VPRDRYAQLAQILHRLPGDRHDDVARLHACFGGRSLGIEARDEHAALDRKLVGGGELRRDADRHDADQGTDDAAVGEQLLDDGLGAVDRDGEADPCASSMMAVLIPITAPLILTSGPPEFPGLIAASVWIRSWRAAPPGSSIDRRPRSPRRP